MESRKTNIHQFTFSCNYYQAKQLYDFSQNKGEVLYDAKFKVKDPEEAEIETEKRGDEVYVKCHLKFFNCGPNLASRKLAEYICNALSN
jgi:hypothetical protein